MDYPMEESVMVSDDERQQQVLAQQVTSNEIERLQKRIARLIEVIEEKDQRIEDLLMKTVEEKECKNCTNLKLKWKKMHASFQEVPKLLESMIQKTDNLFIDS
jgi:23S rRNA C2498 (ribose-2'-O)-methylase RlmM